MAIPIQDARNVFTKQLVQRWNELTELSPKNFLRSFFTKSTSTSKEVSIEVMRGTERVAVDVLRGTGANRNTFSRFKEKLFVPPFYNEDFDATTLDNYDLLFGANAANVNAPIITGMIEQALQKLNILKYKIERAYELQCAQVLESGIVQLVSGDNIDYGRKALSMVTKKPAGYWSVSSVDPRADFITAGDWLRAVGKAGEGEFNAILGSNALKAFLNNPFIDNDKIKTISLVDLRMPQTDAMGGVYHGTISAGPYKVNIWSYPEVYEDNTGTATPYIATNNVYIIPVRSAQLKLAYAGVPAIIRDTRNAEFPEFIGQVEADYYINNYIDAKGKSHVFEILSAGLAIPVSVDRIYSMVVTGTEIVGG